MPVSLQTLVKIGAVTLNPSANRPEMSGSKSRNSHQGA